MEYALAFSREEILKNTFSVMIISAGFNIDENSATSVSVISEFLKFSIVSCLLNTQCPIKAYLLPCS